MRSWELISHYIPASPGGEEFAFLAEDHYSTAHFWENESGQRAFQEAQQLAAAGWELVSVVPETTARASGSAGLGGIVNGYILFFKREVANSTPLSGEKEV